MALIAVSAVGGCYGRPNDTYAPCTTFCNNKQDECIPVAIAAVDTSGSFCSRACTKDDDCQSRFGFSGACYAIEKTARICYQHCTADSDCYTTSVCVRLTLTSGGSDYVCVPNL